jgi:hypothetical protein
LNLQTPLITSYSASNNLYAIFGDNRENLNLSTHGKNVYDRVNKLWEHPNSQQQSVNPYYVLGYIVATEYIVSLISGNSVNLDGTPSIPADLLVGNFSSLTVNSIDVAVKESPSFTGSVVLPVTTAIGSVTDTEIGYLGGVTSSIQTQLNSIIARLDAAGI